MSKKVQYGILLTNFGIRLDELFSQRNGLSLGITKIVISNNIGRSGFGYGYVQTNVFVRYAYCAVSTKIYGNFA